MPKRVTAKNRRTMTQGDSLADILERVLETGVVVAGDIRVQVADIELLTIQIRLIICSVDRAEEMGIDWWKNAPYLSSTQKEESETSESMESETDPSAGESDNDSTEAQLARLDDRLERLEESIAEIAND